MKRTVSFILLLFMLTLLPCSAQLENDNITEGNKVVFVYHIPDSEPEVEPVEEPIEDIVSDDITADTSPEAQNLENVLADSEIEENDYDIDDMYTDVLKGYASYNEGEEDTITLNTEIEGLIPLIQIRQPEKIGVVNYTQLKTTPTKFYDISTSRFYMPEYNISPVSVSESGQIGHFKIGTTYNQYLSSGDLEQTSGIYSKYQYKNFAIKTSYLKTLTTMDSSESDNFYFSTEFKVNQYLTLVQNFSTNPIKKTNKAEFVISVNPFGKKDDDRMRFDFGVSQTHYGLTDTFRGQFRFATNFKL